MIINKMARKFPNFKNKIFLAPMHDVTNLAFRLMAIKYGAGLVSTELLSTNAVVIKNKAIERLTISCKEEKPVVAQLFAENTKNLAKAAKILESKFDIIDFNFGCPSNRIMQQGSGGYLLKDKNKIADIVKTLSKNIKKPLICKIRSGFDKKNINAIEIAKICEKNGASAITIHARTVDQGYSGKADWNIIKQVKKSVKIPVIGNGDITNGKDAKKMFEQTNCDYIMVGRAAIGNPFIFKQINEYLKNGKEIKQTKQEKIKDYFEYIKITRKYNIFSISDARQRAIEFTKGFPGSSNLRQKLNSVKSWEEIDNLIKNF